MSAAPEDPGATDPAETPTDDDDEALAREAELAGQGPDDAPDGELATPLPGFAYDPMFGVVGGVGALEGQPDVPRLVSRWPGEVLLHVRGRRASSATVALTAIGFLTFVSLTCMAIDEPADLDLRRLAGWWWFVWLTAGAVFAGGLGFQLIAHAAEVSFTSDGIGRVGRGGDAFVPWSDVRGYRAGDGVLIVDVVSDGEAGHLVVPTSDEERAAEITRLLDGRGVQRLA